MFLYLTTGLVCKKLGHLEDALDCFIKLHAILRNNAEVIYQIANLYPFLIDPPALPFHMWGDQAKWVGTHKYCV